MNTAVDFSSVQISSVIDDSVLRKQTGPFEKWVVLVKELVKNSHDHDAKNITIIELIDGARRHISVLDDGIGAHDEGLKGIVSLDFSPSKKAVANAYGKNGNGMKGAVHHCRALRVETRRPGENVLYVIEFTWEELIAMWKNGSATWKRIPVPPNHPLRVSGLMVTMLDVGKGEGVNPAHDRSIACLIDNLGLNIPTSLSKRVKLIDARQKKYSLKPRKLLGEKIEGEGNIEGIGSITYELGVVPDPDTMTDPIGIWVMEYVCDIRTFLNSIPQTAALAPLLHSIRASFEHLQVNGMIALANANLFLDSTGRTNFKQEFFDDKNKMFALVTFFHQTILPQLDKVLGKQKPDTQRDSDMENTRQKLVGIMQRAGAAPTSNTPVCDVDALRTNVGSVELEPGDQVTFRIVDPKLNAKYEWNATGSGGLLNRKTGSEVTFTAGDCQGEFSLSVSDGQQSTEIALSIVQELPFKFTKPVVHNFPGESVTLKLKNTRHTSGKFDWDSSKCGGTLNVQSNTCSATHKAGEDLKMFSVTVTERSPAAGKEPKSATCYISIETARTDRKDMSQPSDSVFQYPKNGPLFELNFVDFVGIPGGSITSLARPQIGGRPTIISINARHIGFADQPSNVQDNFALTQIALRIANLEMLRDGTFELSQDMGSNQFFGRTGAILTDILSRGVSRR